MTSPRTTRTTVRLVDGLLTAAMLVCFSLAGWQFAGNHVSLAAISTAQSGRLGLDPATQQSRIETQPAEILKAETKLKTKAIEEIRLGQRVVGRNPLRHETQSPSTITPESWRVVQLSMFEFGVEYDLQFLRSTDWLRHEGAAVGSTIHLKLPEMGLDGPALVKSIAPCPPLEADDGPRHGEPGRMLVTGTMRHLASNILDVSITGLDEPLGFTDTHPIWSETRQVFVVAGQLEVGEHLRSATGTLAQVTRITPRRGPPDAARQRRFTTLKSTESMSIKSVQMGYSFTTRARMSMAESQPSTKPLTGLNSFLDKVISLFRMVDIYLRMV